MPVIGVDCEWKPSLVKFSPHRVALMQVGNLEKVFLFDMLVVNKYKEFDDLMTEVFKTKNIVGMSFHNDLQMMRT